MRGASCVVMPGVVRKRGRSNGNGRVAKRFRTGYRQSVTPYTSSVQNVTLAPDRMRLKLKYAQTGIVFTAVDYDTHIFSMNGCFDPDITGVGHQPMGFDQWGALFTQYRVYASMIRILCANDATAQNTSYILGTYPSNSGTTVATLEAALEQPRMKKALVTPGRGEPGIVSNYVRTVDLAGGTLGAENQYRGTLSANPTIQFRWHIFGGTLDVTTNIDVTFVVEIEYYVEFSQRTIPGQS